MAALYNIREQNFDPTWFFKDAFWRVNSYQFSWPSDHYPYHSIIHIKKLNKLNIMEWVEGQETTVFYDIVDKTYTRMVNYYEGYEIRNEWYRFWFKTSEANLKFNLVFGDCISSKITEYHPDHPEHNGKIQGGRLINNDKFDEFEGRPTI